MKTPTLAEIREAAKFDPKRRRPNIHQLAAFINEKLPGYRATVQPWKTSTDRKIPGSRLRWPGKGRQGYRLEVEDTTVREGCLEMHPRVFTHETGETYRHNGDVARWILEHRS
jgi:hypothetical protein